MNPITDRHLMSLLAANIPTSVKWVGIVVFLAVVILSPVTGFGEEIHYRRLSVNEGLTPVSYTHLTLPTTPY